ncbi:MAG: hypothetical protein RL698_1232 [Pseudomonadota bacterium]|jgi:23S rRNA-/tRNA-specific pseudouridylate synthase
MGGAAPAILWEGHGLVVADKPAGLPSTGRTLADPDCLQSQLILARGRMLWAVHQLDASTSGAILFAERKSLVEATSRRMRPPLGRKVYLAICRGEADSERFSIALPIARRETPRGGVISVAPDGRPARTDVRVVAKASGCSLLEVSIASGRTHQVRVHLAYVGLPLLGEGRYASPPCDLHSRVALHSWTIALAPTAAQPRIVVTSPPPEDLGRLCERLGLALPAPR